MKFNAPLGITDQIPHAVQRLLSLGGGFALRDATVLSKFDDTLKKVNTTLTRGNDGVPGEIAKKIVSKLSKLIQKFELPENPSHLQKSLLQAIRYIKNNNWILEADKNLGLVLMSEAEYNKLLFSQINEDSFTETPTFPFFEILRKIRETLVESHIPMRNHEDIMDYAKERRDACPFYVLPKIHKATVGARPITAQHSYLLSNLSTQLSNILNVEVRKLPAITLNSKQFVAQMENIRLPAEFFS